MRLDKFLAHNGFGTRKDVKILVKKGMVTVNHDVVPSLYNSLGSEVTVIEMLPEILGGLDPEISAMLRDIYTKRSIRFHLSCKVTEIKDNEVIFVDSEGAQASVTGEKILMSVGRRAVTTGFGLETLGVETERGAIRVDAKMRTNVPNVYAAGDITGFFFNPKL